LNKDKELAPGTVLAIYPGLVHLSEYLQDQKYVERLLPDEELMLMSRIDGHVIDARSSSEVPFNPYALGHKINHCGADNSPNVMQV
jgi:hypothetical protein